MSKIRVTVWNEFRHEKTQEEAKKLYPNGLHAVIGEYLGKQDDIEVTLAALDDPEQGLSEDVLNNTDVLVWWGHMAHAEVDDALVARICKRVFLGQMGLVVLHSGHHSKLFRSVIGTTGHLSWGREQKEIVWNINPTHPIAAGIPDHFLIESEELYAEPFYIAEPDETIFTSWFEDGFILRSGVVFKRAAGKIFYFQPGHETCPSYHNEYVLRVILNGVRYVKPATEGYEIKDIAPHWQFSVLDEFENK
ncbi:MAG: ThuA domain-containing protein [Clostridia bacterium]|nr:ThuA domain-containing protein [Clostridia bacterium]